MLVRRGNDMTENKDIFAKNLNALIKRSKKSKMQIAEDLGIAPTTFYDWCNGITFPRNDYI